MRGGCVIAAGRCGIATSSRTEKKRRKASQAGAPRQLGAPARPPPKNTPRRIRGCTFLLWPNSLPNILPMYECIRRKRLSDARVLTWFSTRRRGRVGTTRDTTKPRNSQLSPRLQRLSLLGHCVTVELQNAVGTNEHRTCSSAW
jgi:hypothetical protein